MKSEDKNMKNKSPALLAGVETFLKGWPFPVVGLSLLFFSTLFLVGLIALPLGSTGLETLARDIKVWCFGYDPATGSWEWAYFIMFFFGPFFVSASLLALWGGELKEILSRRPLATLPYVGGSFIAVALGVASLFVFYPQTTAEFDKERPFDARGLRTSIPAHSFELINQEGKKISLDKLQGRVVMVTGVYATCSFT